MSDQGLSAIRAAAAGHHFQTLDFLTHGFVEDGVGQEDHPVGAGVGVVVLTSFAWTEYARLIGVHSFTSFSVGRVPGCAHTCGAICLSDVLILAVLSSKSTILTRFTPKVCYIDFIKPEHEEEARMLATVYLDGKKLKRIRTLKGKTQRALSGDSGVSTSTIWLLERREKNENFHPPTLTKLARALGVEPTDLVSGE